MNDDFIDKSLPKVRKEFAESLYIKISADAPDLTRQKKESWIRKNRRLQAAAILLGLLLLIAWSQLRFFIRYVPVGDLWLVEYDRSTQSVTNEQSVIPFVPTPLPTRELIYPTVIVGTEVPVVYYFIPSWIPEGFQDVENLDEMMFWDSTLWVWTNDAGEQIRLSWPEKAGGMHPYAPQGMWKEVSINGQPAILIQGRLALTSPNNPTANREWDETLGLQLSWSVRDLLYTLETYGPYVSESDLIRMAESTTWIPYTP